MSRYSSSLLVQEEGFHQLLGEVNKSRGIPRASLAKEVAIVVTQAMVSFSQVTHAMMSYDMHVDVTDEVIVLITPPLQGHAIYERSFFVGERRSLS